MDIVVFKPYAAALMTETSHAGFYGVLCLQIGIEQTVHR